MRARLLRLGQVLLVGALIFRVFATSVLADQAGLSLGSALDQARTQNPQLAMARARVSEAEGMREQAGLLPNPSLYATSENTPLGGRHRRLRLSEPEDRARRQARPAGRVRF